MKKNLQLAIIVITIIVGMTSCNRQNLPEFASGRFHHKEKSNKQTDETILAIQQRDKIESIAAKTPEQFQTATTDEKLHPLAVNKISTTHSAGKKAIKARVKSMAKENALTNDGVLKTNYSKSSIDELYKPTSVQSHPDRNDRLLCAIIAIFIPFLGVGLYEGIDTNFWIDLILCLLFWLPGIIFALIVILSD